MEVGGAEVYGFRELSERWRLVGSVKDAADFCDDRPVLGIDRHAFGIATTARTKAGGLRGRQGVMDTHIGRLGGTRWARWPTVDSGRGDRVPEEPVGGLVPRDDPRPTRIVGYGLLGLRVFVRRPHGPPVWLHDVPAAIRLLLSNPGGPPRGGGRRAPRAAVPGRLAPLEEKAACTRLLGPSWLRCFSAT